MPEKLEIEDFSGGVTDYYLNAPPNKMRQCDNLLLSKSSGSPKPFTRPGSKLYSDSYPRPVANRISTLINYRQKLFAQSSTKFYYYTNSGWVDILGTATSGPPTSKLSRAALPLADTTSVVSYGTWNNHILYSHSNNSSGRQYPQKIYLDNSNVPQVVQAGLPIPGNFTATPNSAGGTSYIYAIVYRHDYTTTGGVTFSDYSSPKYVTCATSAIASGIVVTLPALVSGNQQNYDVQNTKIEVYRTQGNGTVLYYVTERANGTSSCTDSASDSSISTNATLYNTDGRVDNDPPPFCKFVHVFGDTAYYANIQDPTALTYLPYRVLQSVPGDIDAVPGDFYLDLEDEITGISSTRSYLILMTEKGVYRVDGQYDELGRGGMVAEKISDTGGCISSQSVVQTLEGIFYAGYDGIYFTDGNNVLRINGDYDKTWTEFVSTAGVYDSTKQRRIQGKYDKRKNRIWWSVQHTSGTDVDKCYILDIDQGIKPNATFTTCTGLSSWSPTAIEFDDNGDLIRGDVDGVIFKHSDTLYSDLKKDTSISPENTWATKWSKQTIFWTLETIGFNFGTSFTRKYVPSMNVTCQAPSQLSMQIQSNNDDDHMIADLSPIRFRGVLTWQETDQYWQDPSLIWNYAGLISEKRHFPVKNLRCNFKSIIFKNAFVNTFGSDILGTADVNSSSKQVTLNGSFEWPTNSVDWYIAFSNDDYTKSYLVTAVNTATLTYSDAPNESSDLTATKWILRGYPKDEILNLLNYSVHYELFGQTQGVFNNADKGDNA